MAGNQGGWRTEDMKIDMLFDSSLYYPGFRIEETKVSNKKRGRWRTEETKRDMLFVRKLGIKHRE